MRKIVTGSKPEYIAYLDENKTMDRSRMAFNLTAKFGLSKKEAASLVREWYFAECNKPSSEPEEESEEEGEEEDE